MLKRMKWLCGVVLFLSLVLLLVPVLATTTWQQTGGPEGGIINALAMDPSNSQTIYAGTGGGGVFKSLNGGGSWSPANVGLNGGHIRALAIDPDNGQTIYAGTDGGVVSKSSDGGGTWSPTGALGSSNRVAALAIDRNNSQTIYAGTSWSGLFKSSNAGGTWNLSGVAPFGVYSVVIDPGNSQTVYAGTDSGLYQSGDGGSSWAIVNSGFPSPYPLVFSLVIDPNNSQIVYAALWGDGVYKSTNSGANWVYMGMSGNYIRSLAIDASNSQVIYAATDNGGVHQSLNGGGTWSPVNSGLFNLAAQALAIDPNGQALYAGTYGGSVFKGQSGTTVTPTISGTPAASVCVGAAYSFTPSSSGAVSFTVQNLPPWAGFDTTTGALTGTPLTAGTWSSIAISAVNGSQSAVLPAFSITASSTGACAPSSCLTPPSGMVGWWPLDTAGASSIIGSYTGVLDGTPPPAAASGKVGNALFFDGNNQVRVSNATLLNIGATSFSLDAWVNPGDISGVQSIIDKRGEQSPGGGGEYGYHVYLYNGRLGVRLADGTPGNNYGGTNYYVPANMAIGTGSWHFVGVSVDRIGHTITFNVDGTPFSQPYSYWSTAGNHSGSLLNTADLLIGGHYNAYPGGAPFLGGIDEVEVFNRALSAGELASICSAGHGGKCKNVSGYLVNTPATVTGTPSTSTSSGSSYSFTPTVSDVDGNTLTYGIVNQPSWATFDSSTGTLSGSPVAGTYSDIMILVSDGTTITPLPPFTITVAASGGGTQVPVMEGWWLLPGALAGIGIMLRRRKE